MKRIIIFIVAFIACYSIYYDLTTGTLTPITVASDVIQDEILPTNKPYTLVEIKPGDTVLSIYEKNHSSPIPVSIEQLISDFKELNDQVKPEQIQIGKIYKMPIYNE